MAESYWVLNKLFNISVETMNHVADDYFIFKLEI